MLGNFLDSNLTLLNRFYDLHRQTMDLALREPTVLEILLKLRGLIHADITFFDNTKDRRTTTSQELSRFTMPRLTEFTENQYRSHRYFDAELTYPELTRFIDPRVRELHDRSFEFFETASVLCENNLNYQETARQLFMHPKTIRYRSERIQKTTGLDFHNPDDRLQIALGSRIFRLLDKEN